MPEGTWFFRNHPGMGFMLYPPAWSQLVHVQKPWGHLHQFSFFPKEKLFLPSKLFVGLCPKGLQAAIGIKEMPTVSRIL